MRVLVVGLFCRLAAWACAAEPDWAVAARTAPVPPSAGFAVLLDRWTVTYVAAERTRRVIDYEVRLADENARVPVLFFMQYNSDTDRIVSAKAWITGPGGGRAKAYGIGDFLESSQFDNQMWNGFRVLSFADSNRLQSGGAFSCEIVTEQPAGVFECAKDFARTHYTVKTALDVIPPAGYSLVWHATSPSLPSPTPTAEPGGLHWELGPGKAPGIQGAPKGFMASPLFVTVRAEQAGEKPAWSDMAGRAAEVMSPAIRTPPAIEAEASELVAGKTGRWDRIRALTEFVQKQIVYLQVQIDHDALAGWRPHPADEVLEKRLGDCKDKASLLVSLLRAAGEDGRVLLVNPEAPQMVTDAWPTLFFDHAIVGIPAGGAAPQGWPVFDAGPLGKMVAFDPTDTTTPLGVLSPQDAGAWSVVVDASKGGLARLPQVQVSRVDRVLDGSLDADGSLSASMSEDRLGLAGSQAYTQRSVTTSERMQKSLIAGLESVAPSIRSFSWDDRWEPDDAHYHLHFRFRAERYGRPLTDQLMAFNPEALHASNSQWPEWKTHREGVSWLWTGDTRDHVKIRLPDSFAVEELPENWNKHGATVSCSLQYAVKDGVLDFESAYSIRPGYYDQKRYEAIRRFMVGFFEAQRRPVLLRRKSAS